MPAALTTGEVAVTTAAIAVALRNDLIPQEAREDAANAWFKLRASAGMPLTDHEGRRPGTDY